METNVMTLTDGSLSILTWYCRVSNVEALQHTKSKRHSIDVPNQNINEYRRRHTYASMCKYTDTIMYTHINLHITHAYTRT